MYRVRESIGSISLPCTDYTVTGLNVVKNISKYCSSLHNIYIYILGKPFRDIRVSDHDLEHRILIKNTFKFGK